MEWNVVRGRAYKPIFDKGVFHMPLLRIPAENPKTTPMKRLSTIATVVLITTGMHAQQKGGMQLPSLHQPQHEEQVQRPAQHASAQMDGLREVLFSEDFANGLAGNNGMGAWTVSGTNGNVWKRTTTKPVGAYNTFATVLESPTASNGFMLFDSDSVNSNFSVDPPVANNPRVNQAGSLISPIMDLSGPDAVEIRFTQQFRYCCSNDASKTLDVSTDGGNTWPTTIDISQGTNANITFPSGEAAFNLTSALGNGDRSNVRIRFTEGGANSAYYWELDDISINALPSNELIMDYGYTSQFGGGYEYGRVPQNQMLNTLMVGAGIINYGSNTQTNVTVFVSLKNADGTEIGSSTVALGTIAPTDTAVADAVIPIPLPLPVGLYAAYFTMTSDSIGVDALPSNNFKNRYFEVTNDLYSIDGVGVVPDSTLFLTSTGTDSFTDNTQDVRLLNYFEVHTGTTFTGIEVYLSTQTQPGSYFIAAVYDTADVFLNGSPSLSSPLVESDPRLITQDDMDNGRRPAVSFIDPITLAPGAYYVSANMYQEGGNNMRIVDDLTTPQPSAASALYIPIDANNQNIYGGNGNAWCIRLSGQMNVGVQEAPGLDGVTMYPSPTVGPLQVRTRTAGNMTVEVFNALGTKVQNTNFNGTSTSLDLSGHAAGIYMVRVGDGTNYNVQRIVLR